ncbi:MAG: hypothetical protein E2O47_05660 [Gemmatimonadetes bacterium]|nr:MAG: hypothetical protein E2O47_05660 [Gemmatimonadota bacterium]
MPRCEHFDGSEITDLPTVVDGCEQCLASGDTWVHLRMCLNCGHIGCCDSSKNQHAREHHTAQDHVLIRSAEPGETWAYCYTHDQYTNLG